MVEALRRPAAAAAAPALLRPAPPALAAAPLLEVRGLGVRAGRRWLLRGIDLDVPAGGVLGIVGPSGTGKSTLLKCLNRLIDLDPGLTVSGDVRFHGRPVYGRGTDPDRLRERIGIVFQQPVVFPGSILGNVLFGVRHLRAAPRERWPGLAERALARAGLWREVRDRLERPAAELSVGQQQRLCLARALALNPEVLLLDEPTSALDPAAAAAVERLIVELKGKTTLVLVTHDLRQAGRVTDRIACLAMRDGAGEIAFSAATLGALRDLGRGAGERAAAAEPAPEEAR